MEKICQDTASDNVDECVVRSGFMQMSGLEGVAVDSGFGLKEFLEDGKEYINAYRPKREEFLNKRFLLFYSLFALLTIGGSFIFCLYIFPRIFPYPDGKSIPKLAKPYIFRAISLADRRLYEQACIELERACDLGYCEDYDLKKREGVCQ